MGHLEWLVLVSGNVAQINSKQTCASSAKVHCRLGRRVRWAGAGMVHLPVRTGVGGGASSRGLPVQTYSAISTVYAVALKCLMIVGRGRVRR